MTTFAKWGISDDDHEIAHRYLPSGKTLCGFRGEGVVEIQGLVDIADVPHCKHCSEGIILSEQIDRLRRDSKGYPIGYVVGPCICGSWPGGPCLRCKRVS